MKNQQGDVLIFQTVDDGEISVENGLFEMTQGFETALYLALFGGNRDDPGGSDTSKSWWGNVDESDIDNTYRSETQFLLSSLPATAANLKKLEQAVIRDLKFLTSKNIISSISAVASIPGRNKVNIAVEFEARGEEKNFEFTENWRSYV